MDEGVRRRLDTVASWSWIWARKRKSERAQAVWLGHHLLVGVQDEKEGKKVADMGRREEGGDLGSWLGRGSGEAQQLWNLELRLQRKVWR